MRDVEGAAPYRDCAGGDVGEAFRLPRAGTETRPYIIFGSGKQLPYGIVRRVEKSSPNGELIFYSFASFASKNMPAITITKPTITIMLGYSPRKSATHNGPKIISHRAMTEAFWGLTFCTPIL